MVAHASNSHANGKSPAHNAFQMFFGGLESLGQAYDPFFKGLARTQLEVLGFANRRAQAYMQIPATPPSAARRRICSTSKLSSGAPLTRTTRRAWGA